MIITILNDLQPTSLQNLKIVISSSSGSWSERTGGTPSLHNISMFPSSISSILWVLGLTVRVPADEDTSILVIGTGGVWARGNREEKHSSVDGPGQYKEDDAEPNDEDATDGREEINEKHFIRPMFFS